MDVTSLLYVELLEAKEVLPMDITGTSDPYCFLDFYLEGDIANRKNADISFCTDVVYKTLSPKWRGCEYVVKNPTAASVLTITMWDKDEVTSDDFMGYVELPVQGMVPGRPYTAWMVLKNKKNKEDKARGEIYIKYHYVDIIDWQRQLDKYSLILCKNTLLHSEVEDDLLRSFITLYCKNHSANMMEMLTTLVRLEVDHTVYPETLFRQNSTATRTITFIIRKLAGVVLDLTLSPILREIHSQPTAFEVDPSKVPAGESVERNRDHVSELMNKIFYSIINAVGKYPAALVQTMQLLHEIVNEKFPELGQVGMGAILFLRYLCPSLIAPDRYGLLPSESISPQGVRFLLLITKVLQNLVNGVSFGKKEEYMVPFNAWIESHTDHLRLFYENIIDYGTLDASSIEDQLLDIGKEMDIAKYVMIMEYIVSTEDMLAKLFPDTGFLFVERHKMIPSYYHIYCSRLGSEIRKRRKGSTVKK